MKSYDIKLYNQLNYSLRQRLGGFLPWKTIAIAQANHVVRLDVRIELAAKIAEPHDMRFAPRTEIHKNSMKESHRDLLCPSLSP